MTRSIAVLVAVVLAFQAKSDDLDKALKTVKAADIQRHQVYIASDELEGRDAGSDGGHKAALYIVQHLEKCGFEPAAADGGWFQPFGGGGAMGDVAEANALRLFKDSSKKTNEIFKLNEHFLPVPGSRCGQAGGNVVFAGYGISAPDLGYDDWKGPNVKGQIALILDGEPQEKDPASKFDGDKPSKYSVLDGKIESAAKAGAAFLLVVGGGSPLPKTEDGWPPPADKRSAKTAIPVAWISAEAGEKLASAAGKSLKGLREEIDKEFKTKTFKVSKPVWAGVAYAGLPGKGTKNIVAVWKGTDEKLASEYVVIGAHYDHVGLGRTRSNGGKAGQIHNGADDNGSGTSTVLDVAEAVKEFKTKRSVVIMWFDSEENGLVGSKHWVGSPTLPLEKCVFMINLDMIGRNDIKQILTGLQKEGGSIKYPKLEKLMQEAERRFGCRFDWDGADDLIQRSDHWSFMERGIPAIFFTGGLHADYHTERDKVEKINFPKEELIGKLAVWLAWRAANMDGSLK